MEGDCFRGSWWLEGGFWVWYLLIGRVIGWSKWEGWRCYCREEVCWRRFSWIVGRDG